MLASISAPIALIWAPTSLAVGDPGRTRTVLAAVLTLIAIGVGLVVLAGWLVRSTRVDPEVLTPLEVMGERSWRRADPVWQRRRLDEARPTEAEPLDPTASPPLADAESDLGPRLGGVDDFDDLLRQLGIHLEDSSPDEVAGSTVDHDPSVVRSVTVDALSGDDATDDAEAGGGATGGGATGGDATAGAPAVDPEAVNGDGLTDEMAENGDGALDDAGERR